jgi:hypothetical protein
MKASLLGLVKALGVLVVLLASFMAMFVGGFIGLVELEISGTTSHALGMLALAAFGVIGFVASCTELVTR